MSSSLDFAQYVMEQLEGIGIIRHRKMFGEYCIYINDKPIVLICDDQVFAKKIPALVQICQNCEVGIPYDGATERYIIDIDNRPLAQEVFTILEQNTPPPKPKPPRKPKK